jgi:hypothetical protein
MVVLAISGCELMFAIDEPTLGRDAGSDASVDSGALDARDVEAAIDAVDAGAEAPECSQPADCDDGVFCNGVENCSASGQCQSGTPPVQQIVVCKAGATCPGDYYVGAQGADPKCGPACCCETTLYCELACAESLVACCVDGVCKCPNGYYQTGTTTALCFCGSAEGPAITCERM